MKTADLNHRKTRERMRAFAKLVEAQDPAALAADVETTAIPLTLQTCKRIQRFFAAYVVALGARQQ